MKKFEQSAKTFADGISGRNYVADVNFTAAAIAKLSLGTTKTILKDDLISEMNKIQKESIGITMEEDDSTWDDIFFELRDEGILKLETHKVRLTDKAVEAIKTKYGEIDF